jgi:hypothetical protein
MSNNFSNAMGAVGVFVAAHPEIAPERLELTISSICRWLKKKGRPVTKVSMDDAWASIISSIEALRPEEAAPETTEAEDAETEKFRQQIDSWSSAQMKEFCKDPAVAATVENVLNQPRTQPKKETPKPQPKAKVKPPVKDPLVAAIDKMTSDQMKKALQDPAKARGIENVLSRRNN